MSRAERDRALGEFRAMMAARPAVPPPDRHQLPSWLGTRYFGQMWVGALGLTASGCALFLANDGAWYFHLFGVLLVLLGAVLGASPLLEANLRRAEATRIELAGPDAADTVKVLWAARWWVPRWGDLLTLALVLAGGLVVYLVAVESTAPYAVAVMVVGYVIGSVLTHSGAARAARWRLDFIRERGLEFPLVPDSWKSLLP